MHYWKHFVLKLISFSSRQLQINKRAVITKQQIITKWGTIDIWRPWKFKTPYPPLCPATSKILPPPRPSMSNFKRIPPLKMITNQLKGNIILGWLLYVIRSFLQVGFRFQYQVINLAWLSIGFFSFSWSQSRPRSIFKKLKTSLSPYSYIEKMRWGQDWAEASLSTFRGFKLCVQLSKNITKFFLKKSFF